jgi:hypothetical protein
VANHDAYLRLNFVLGKTDFSNGRVRKTFRGARVALVSDRALAFSTPKIGVVGSAILSRRQKEIRTKKAGKRPGAVIEHVAIRRIPSSELAPVERGYVERNTGRA